MLRMLDVMDLSDIQRLQDTFAQATGIIAVIVDPDGISITEPSNFERLCLHLYPDGEDGEKCECRGRLQGSRVYKEHAPLHNKCPNHSIFDISAPIIMEGHYLGNLVIGQRYRRILPLHSLSDMSTRCHLTSSEISDEYAKFPLLHETSFSETIKLLPLLVNYFSDVCQKNYQINLAHQEKEQASSNMRTVLNNAGMLISVIDPETFELVFLSESMERLLGGEITPGMKCYWALYGRTEPCEACIKDQLFAGKGDLLNASSMHESYNPASKHYYQMVDRLITWQTGKLMLMHIAVDITERKALAQVEAATIARRNFFSSMSHELRTPLNGVLGMTQLALKASTDPSQQEYLKKIASSANILLGVIDDSLDFSKIEAGRLELNFETFSLREDVLLVMQNIFQPRVEEKGLLFTIDTAPTVPDLLVGDVLRFSQILLNLLGNSFKFTQKGSIILTITANDMLDPESGVPTDLIRLDCCVKDTGIGIAEETARRLFEPFMQGAATTSRKYGGTGLGLSISHALVKMMGGDIWVDSVIGKGCSLSLFVVMKKGKKRNKPEYIASAASDTSLVLQDCRILLVEDNEINQEIAFELLKTFGATVDIAKDGIEAVEMFLVRPYSLIFMDLQMPHMGGIEATEAIRKGEAANESKKGMRIPIIAMTANAMIEDRQACYDAGMNEHIAKPINIDELEQLLRKWAPHSTQK